MKVEKFKIGDKVKSFDPMLEPEFIGEVGTIDNAVELGNDSVMLIIEYPDKSKVKAHAEYTTHFYETVDDMDDPMIRIKMRQSELMDIMADALAGAIDSVIYQLLNGKSEKDESDD